MTISTLNKRSDSHNSCEDTIWVEDTNKDYIVGGIFDGCSTGTNSHWASQTLAYAFKYFLLTFSRQEPEKLLEDNSMYGIMVWLKNVLDNFGLSQMNFLSTAIVFVYNKNTKQLRVRCFGDGVYYINDVEYEIEQNNIPDYLGYYLTSSWDDKMRYLGKYPIKIYEDVDRFVICSDGIKAIQLPQLLEQDVVDPLVKLLHPPNNAFYLTRQYNLLKQQKVILNDDLSIISYAAT